MRSTGIDRRTFLALAGAAALPIGKGFAAEPEALFLAARANGQKYEVAVFDERGKDRLVLPLEARGHSFAIDNTRRRAVAFARSPGRFAVAFDFAGKRDPVAIAAAPGRHFFGHGIYTPDGKLMLATENDFDGERGVTGIYDATGGFARIGEIATDGIGPHEVLLMGDGRTMCVANGGILTHPNYDRLKLNIATMQPSLVYLDIEHGEVVGKATLPADLHQLSIRHMVLDARGDVWFGCQYEGDPTHFPTLVGRHRRGGDIELFRAPDDIHKAMRNYVGSIAIDATGAMVATSSPHGGIVVFWDTATGQCLGTTELADGCGIAPLEPQAIMATSGRGAIVEASPDAQHALREADPTLPAWDNHLRRIGTSPLGERSARSAG